MDDTQLEQIIRNYLPQIIHMSAASVGEDSKPWSWEVHYAFDDDLNLYWCSSQSARHSQELAKNPNISGTIVVQHHLDQLVRGVSFEGRVEVVEGVNEDHPAFKAYAGRFPERAGMILKGYQDNSPGAPRIYKIHVADFYMADGLKTGRPEKYHLRWGR